MGRSQDAASKSTTTKEGEVMAELRAVYKDQQGRTYSCPVEISEGKWMMKTSDGPAPITFYFDDDIGGRLTFVNYREELPSEGSRIHVERGSTWAAHKLAFAQQQLAQERRDRENARTEMQNVP